MRVKLKKEKKKKIRQKLATNAANLRKPCLHRQSFRIRDQVQTWIISCTKNNFHYSSIERMTLLKLQFKRGKKRPDESNHARIQFTRTTRVDC